MSLVGRTARRGNTWRVLERAAQFRGLPLAICTDQNPEFTSKVLDKWAHQNGVQLKLIEAGQARQNAYIESFNVPFGMNA